MNRTSTGFIIPESSSLGYQAKLLTPFAVLGIRIEEDWLTGIDYLPLNSPTFPPTGLFASEICQQLYAYLENPRFVFDLSMHIGGTQYQRRVWEQIQAIPGGSTRSYGEISRILHSALRTPHRVRWGRPAVRIVFPL